jgi:hypothetical protein
MRRWRFRFSLIRATLVFALIFSIASVHSELVDRRRSRYERAREQISEMRNELSEFYRDNGFYPKSLEGLRAVTGFVPSDIDRGILRPRPKVVAEPCDPWGNPFYYKTDGQVYVLGSFGPTINRAHPEIEVNSADRHP